MRKVLFCSQTASAVGGVAQRLGPLTELLPALGWEPVVALAWGARFHDPEAFRSMNPGLASVTLDGRTGSRGSRSLAIEKALDKVRPEVVVPLHVFDALETVRRRKMRGRGERLVFGLFEISAELLLDCRTYAPILDGAIGNSKLICELLKQVAGMPPATTRYVPQGITPAVRPRVHAEGPIHLGYFGRLSEDKRVLDLVSLARELDLRGVEFRMLVVGDGPLRSALCVAMRQWEERGIFMIRAAVPKRELYQTAYPSIDASVLLSAREGSPNLPLESLAHGVVPIVSDFDGRAMEGILRHENTALVFDVGDTRRAAEHVEALAHNLELRRAMAERGRAKVSGLSLERMAATWASVLDATVEGPCAQAPVNVPTWPPGGRLDRWFGDRVAERIRRLTRRRSLHLDASEWPFYGGWPSQELREVNLDIARVCAVARKGD